MSLMRSRTAESSGYRPEIDGLRAFAVLSVILYHAGYDTFHGGFVGVDVFFVLSGFLITRIIEREIDENRFSFFAFYDRRIRRIFPALFAMAAVCTALAAALFPPHRFLDYGRSLAAMAAFSSNIYFFHAGRYEGYFAPAANLQLLLQTWSLAVEEQFYVVFPVLLVLLAKVKKSHQRILLGAGMLLSLGWSAWAALHHPVAGFYLLPSRAWELLLGALLALKVLHTLTNRVAQEALSLTGLAMLAYSVLTYSEQTPFPGLYALVPCVGTWLILYANERSGSLTGRLLSLPPLVWIGALSYSLYLWHWPVFLFARYYYAREVQRFEIPALLGIVFGLALLSFLLVETPFRRHRTTISTPQRTCWIGLAASVGFAAIALSIAFSGGWPARFSAEKSSVLAQNDARKDEYPRIDPSCNNYQTKIEQYSDVQFCAVGQSAKNILFWGDSHVEQLYPLLERLQKEGNFDGRGAVFAIAGACPPSQTLNRSTGNFHCDAFARFALERAGRDDIDTVFIQFLPWWTTVDGMVCLSSDGRCVGNITGVDAGRHVIEEMGNTIRILKANGKRVILGLPFPFYSLEIPDYLIRKTTIGRFAPRYGLFDLTRMEFQNSLRDTAVQAGAEIYDPRLTLCPNGQCIFEKGGVSLYIDGGHIATSQIDIVREGILKALRGTAMTGGTPRN